jgi:hypothetical protein
MKSARSALAFAAVALCAAVAPIAAAEPALPTTPVDTVIESKGPLEMVSTETTSTFTFSEEVVITATNLRMTCDKLVVVTRRAGDPAATLGQQKNFKSLLATGHVRIRQNDREAECDRAEILPGEDKIALDGNLKITTYGESGKFVQSGARGWLYRGQRRAVIERPRLVGPSLQDLGFEKEPDKKKAAAPAPKDDNAK